MKINVCTGYPLDSPRGNTTTAKRYEKLLCRAGFDAVAMHTDSPPNADVQFSLHALKTAAASIHFAENNPHGKLFIRLTGTDIHGGFEQNPELSQRVIELTENLIVAHPACLHSIPKKWRDKTKVIYPSVHIPPLPEIDRLSVPLFTCVGHLRPVKNPHLMFAALQRLPTQQLRAISIGNAYDATDGQRALVNSRRDTRYRWISGCDRATAISWMRSSLATINSSHSEGGANTIIESICVKTPVLASKIDGNVGLLGENYVGLYDPNNHQDLAKLMLACLSDLGFVDQLNSQISDRADLFAEEREMSELKKIVKNRSQS